jgi:hypothetical protein
MLFPGQDEIEGGRLFIVGLDSPFGFVDLFVDFVHVETPGFADFESRKLSVHRQFIDRGFRELQIMT